MALTVISDLPGMLALASDWEDLHKTARSENPFAHPSWCMAWVETYRPTGARILVARDGSGRLSAVAPLASQGSDGKRWSTLGAPLVDFGDPVLRPGGEGAQVLLRSLVRSAPQWSSVNLIGLRPALAARLVAEAPHTGLRCLIEATQTCPCVHVPSLETWIASLPTGRWKRLKSIRRRLQERLGAVCTDVRNPVDVARAVRRFESLRLQSWWQRGGLHALPPEVRSAAHSRLLRNAVTRLAAVNAASVVELTAGTRLLASSVLFWSGDSVLVALKATDTRLGPAFSPGLALDIFTIQHAVDRGVRSVGFGRGDENYKFVLGARPETTVNVVVTKEGRRTVVHTKAAGQRTAWSRQLRARWRS